MRAIHKYKGSNKMEHKRRIAQSFGYKHTIFDNPNMLALLQRGGIEFDSVDYNTPVSEHKQVAGPHIADTEVITF